MKAFDLTKRNACFVFFITIVACILVNSGSLISSDASKRLQVTHWIWMNAPQVVAGQHDITGLYGKQYAQWGIGQSLLMLPADMVAHAVIVHIHSASVKSVVQIALVSYLTFPLLNAISAVLAYLLLLELSFTSTEAVVGVLALVFGTSFLPYAQIQQENSLIFFALIGGFLGNILWLRTHKIKYLCFGVFCLGWSLLVRVPCILDAFTVAMFCAVSILLGKEEVGKKFNDLLRYVFAFGLLYAPFVLADRVYQWIRFGSVTTTYFAIQMAQARAADPSLPKNYPYTTPLLHGIAGFLFSPAKSIFLFNPLIIVAVILVLRYWKSFNRYVLQFFFWSCFLLLSDMLMYSRLIFWGGDAAWGPRYVLTASQMVSLLAVPVFIRTYPLMRTGFAKALCWLLIAGGCLIQFLGVLFEYNLELGQENGFHVKYIIVWQRLVNAVAISTGNFQSWKLDPGFTNRKLMVLEFMPWHTAGNLPKVITILLETGWVICCFSLFAILVVFLLQVRTKTPRKLL